jgi:hypothetical protein
LLRAGQVARVKRAYQREEDLLATAAYLETTRIVGARGARSGGSTRPASSVARHTACLNLLSRAIGTPAAKDERLHETNGV